MYLPRLDFNRTPVTLLVAAVAVALEIVCTLDELTEGADAARRLYYYNQYLGILPSIWSGELWRPVTTTLMHGGLLHAAFSVYFLLLFGSALEARFGPYRYLGLLVLLAYVSMLPQFLVSTYNANPIMIVGLSGVLYGFLGVLIVGRRFHSELAIACDPRTIQFLLFWLLLCFLLTHAGLLPVANSAHVAGLAFGLLYGKAIFQAPRRAAWLAAASLATALVLAPLIACPGHRGYEAVKRREQIQRILNEAAEEPAAGKPAGK